VTLASDDPSAAAVTILPGATIKGGPVSFETQRELTVLPISAECYFKRPLTAIESRQLGPVVDGLRSVYRLPTAVRPYVTTPVFVDGAPEPGGFDVVSRTVDRCLWLALLAADKESVGPARLTLGGTTSAGAPRVLSVGVSPQIAVPALFEDIGPRARIPHIWELSGIDAGGEPRYFPLDTLTGADTTSGLTRRGVIRLVLPTIGEEDRIPGAVRRITAPSNDVRDKLDAGVGDRPPRLDDEKKAERLIAWLRLRPDGRSSELSLSWVGVNAVEIDGRQTVTGRLLGESDGTADQTLALPGRAVEPETLIIQVAEPDSGYLPWRPIDDLALAGRDDAVFLLDQEAGTIRFGDGVRGRMPPAQARIRAARVRAGGGRAQNLAAGSLTKIENPILLDPTPEPPKLKVIQSLPTDGGEDAETLEEAERRIPSLFRDRDRAVTEEDYRRVAADTPGVRMGRVEVLPRFKPQQRRSQVPGVVTVMTLPYRDGFAPPAPRPDRPFLEAVHAYLDPRRPLATELYVIGCDYVPLGVGAAVAVRDGFGRDAVLQAVRDTLRVYLWPLPPGGHENAGWRLGRAVSDRELEVAVARVPGVSEVRGISLFRRQEDEWQRIGTSGRNGCAPVSLALDPWQLPELLSVVALEGDEAPEDLSGVPNPFVDQGVAVPVVPEVC
jgi:hypothetical protein